MYVCATSPILTFIHECGGYIRNLSNCKRETWTDFQASMVIEPEITIGATGFNNRQSTSVLLFCEKYASKI